MVVLVFSLVVFGVLDVELENFMVMHSPLLCCLEWLVSWSPLPKAFFPLGVFLCWRFWGSQVFSVGVFSLLSIYFKFSKKKKEGSNEIGHNEVRDLEKKNKKE